MAWSHEPKFEIGGISFQLIFWGLLSLEVIFIWVFPLVPFSLSIQFWEDMIRGCCNIQLLISWGHLSIEVIFIWSLFKFWFGPLHSRFKCGEEQANTYGENQDINLGDRDWLHRLCGWWFSQEIMPLRGPILQAKTCQIFSKIGPSVSISILKTAYSFGKSVDLWFHLWIIVFLLFLNLLKI